MEREMVEQQLAALQVEVSTLRGRLGAATAQLCAAATPSNPALMAVLKVRADAQLSCTIGRFVWNWERSMAHSCVQALFLHP
jgi:hypothetical protein